MDGARRPRVSAIVTTYERPEPLARVLEGFFGQTFRDFEVVVADDGSGAPTREVIERVKARGSFPLVHARQEHRGFRAAAARNLGIRAARGEIVVFVDGDCVPFPDFLAVHVAASGPDRLLAGDRYLLEQDEAERVTVESIASGASFDEAPARERKRLLALRAKNVFYTTTRLKPERPKLLTANASALRSELEALNGLDERYEGWGREDDDLRRRFVKAGKSVKSVVGVANLLHLWHAPVASFKGTVRAGPNEPYFHRGYFLARCRRGLVTRSLRELSIAVTGADDTLARSVREALGVAEPPGPVEVELAVDGGPPGPAPRFAREAQVRVLLQALPLEGRRVAGADLVIHGGDDAPGDVRVDARRDRGTGRRTLDAAGIDRALALLDETL